MSNPFFVSFEYDYADESWNLPRGSVPSQLKAQGVPHALWMHFWDYAQSVVERANVRGIMKKKLKLDIDKGHLSEYRQQERRTEISKLDEQTSRDFDCLERQAERLFPNTKASIPKEQQQQGNNHYIGKPFVLELQLLHPHASSGSTTGSGSSSPTTSTGSGGSSSSRGSNDSDTVHLHYDSRRASWNLPRDHLPATLAESGVPMDDWIAIWDYGFGVNQRAKEREHLNQLHERELRLCQKSLTYMNSTNVASVDNNAANNTTANHIRIKMEKLQRAKEANVNNTKKGWQELQRRATQRFEPYGVKVYLSRPDSQICCGLQFQCQHAVMAAKKSKAKRQNSSKETIAQQAAAVSSMSSASPSTSPVRAASPLMFQHRTPSSIWLHSKSPTIPVSHEEQGRVSPISAVWTTIPKQQGQPKRVASVVSSREDTPQSASVASVADTASVLRASKQTTEKENAPPKPEAPVRKHKKKESSISSVWGQPVVLTYVHDEIPSRIDIEVSRPPSPTYSGSEDDSDDDEDSHGYVVPPAPSSDPPSSIGSSSSGSLVVPSLATTPSSAAAKLFAKLKRRVHFGNNSFYTYDSPVFTKMERKSLWFSHEEREACRNKTKILAQRVIDNRNNGGSNNVVFMDSETEEEVCWRGLEHAKKGNLSSRQETRRAFMVKVLEKQRQIQLDSWTSRRGTVADPYGDLQQYAARHSRHCRERAQRLAASDAKEARAVYKESLRRTNLHPNASSGMSVMSGSSNSNASHYSSSRGSYYHPESGHKNDIFQEYCRRQHLATKARLAQQQQAVM